MAIPTAAEKHDREADKRRWKRRRKSRAEKLADYMLRVFGDKTHRFYGFNVTTIKLPSRSDLLAAIRKFYPEDADAK